MCGIAGWISYRRDLRDEKAVIEVMTRTMAARGPDAAGTWLDRHAALGHRRLAVIDLERGAQPMAENAAEGSVVLTFSGEVYNFIELREELRRHGHHFRSRSDTEVVLRGYMEWGEHVVERLNGMYAFAIWDGRHEKLVMVRDRLGVKPLYYHPTPDGVLFGSEPKAILANPLVRPIVGIDGLRELMTMTRTPGHTIWSGMCEVVPGTLIVVDRAGCRERTYWRLETAEHHDDHRATTERVRALLEDSVSRQLVSDVPRCVLLSGGLDSSVITALAARRLAVDDERVRSFAVEFAGQTESFRPDQVRATPDAPYVHDVARHVASHHLDVILDHGEIADLDVRRAVVRARDAPGLCDLDFSLLLLFEAIRERSTVALSGESADELFGGYAWFHDPSSQWASMFPWFVPRMRVAESDPVRLFTPQLEAQLDLTTYLRDRYSDAVGEIVLPREESEQERRMRIVSHLALTRYLPVLLERKDRMSMAVGLEVRVPFADHRLVSYVYNAPWWMKSCDGREKSLLRRATRDVLPDSVVNRVKTPYPSVQDPRYAGTLQRLGKELLADPGHPVFELVDRSWFDRTLQLDPSEMPTSVRSGLDRTLDIATWLELYKPDLQVS